jgi:hypothetical protein
VLAIGGVPSKDKGREGAKLYSRSGGSCSMTNNIHFEEVWNIYSTPAFLACQERVVKRFGRE